jgi:formate hydrogenlyase transcriptional activator
MKEVENKPDILVVDDSEESLRVLVSIIKEEGFEARVMTQGALAIRAARQAPPELILLDIGLPDMDGYQVCAELKGDERTRDIPILFISGLHATADKVKAFSAGGVDYITKPFQIEEIKARIKTHLAVQNMQEALREKNLLLQKEIEVRQRVEQELKQARDELETRVQQALREIEHLTNQLRNENRYLRQEINENRGRQATVGDSQAMRNLLREIEQVASTDTSVLILGETGTGKEVAAQTIHDLSARAHRTMIKVNCAALPSGIVESELFGRLKGAYTGASTDQPGRFEIADGSTLFLDEIGELSQELQAKLLCVLQDGTFERLGSTKTIRVDVRVIAATNRNLEEMVREGKFRQDLYYRLNVFPICIPPLRERGEEILSLTEEFIKEFARKMGKPVKSVEHDTILAMLRYPWPGNIRELRNVVERAMIISSGKTLALQLPSISEFTVREPLQMNDAERRHIITVLERTNWRIKGKNGAAEILGLKPSTLHSKMKKLRIDRPTP